MLVGSVPGGTCHQYDNCIKNRKLEDPPISFRSIVWERCGFPGSYNDTEQSVGYVSGKQSNMLPQVMASLECVFHMFNYLSDIVQEYKG